MYDKTTFLEVLTKTFFGSLSKPNDSVSKMDGLSIDGGIDQSTFVWKKTIDTGNEFRLTYEEAIDGMGTYGDAAVESGDFLGYKNQDFKIHQTKSPAVQVNGEMSRQKVAHSITNIPTAVRRAAIRWMAEELEFDAIIAYLYGASKSLIRPLSAGGLGVSLGPGSGIGSGTPLMGMHWFTPDTGFMTYTPAALSTWNSTVNDGVNGIDEAAADKFTQSFHEKIREKIEDLNWIPGTLNGKEYKAIALCDPQIAYRFGKNILKTDYGASTPREKGDTSNRIFNINYTIEQDDILYLAVRNLKKFRPAYNASNGYIDIGPGLTSDPRNYTTSSTNGLVIYCGAGSLLFATNGQVKITTGYEKHPEDGQEHSARHKFGIKRNQWDSKDDRVTAESTCNSVLTAAFYEPGIDW
jgi:hypothetical protein